MMGFPMVPVVAAVVAAGLAGGEPTRHYGSVYGARTGAGFRSTDTLTTKWRAGLPCLYLAAPSLARLGPSRPNKTTTPWPDRVEYARLYSVF